jgi:hypothetical protein
MEDTRARWDRAFQEAVDYDTWGQVRAERPATQSNLLQAFKRSSCAALIEHRGFDPYVAG